MEILALIHNQTDGVRDQIAALTAQVARAAAERDAAKDQAKRAGAEAAKQKVLEKELKKSCDASLAMVAETQRLLEELDRKRQETAEALNRCQAEQESLSQSLRDAQALAEHALAEIETDRENEQKAEAEISKLLDEKEKKKMDLRDALLGSLFIFLEEQADRVLSVLASEEQRQELLRDYESFQQARQTDPHVGGLCEQRDELRKFLAAAAVPAVKDTLQASLTAVEDELQELFPSAVHVTESAPPSIQVEEFLFYLNSDGHVVFLMPVRTPDWEGAQNEVTADGLRAMRVIWDMMRELRLKERDGGFAMMQSHPVFKSRFDVQEVAVRNAFTVKYNAEVILSFKFTRVPGEVEEILVHEGLASQAADVMSTHPAHILLRAAGMDPEREFEDVWRQVNGAVVGVAPSRADYQKTQGSRLAAGAYLRAIVTKESPEGITRRPDVRCSGFSVRVADSLYRQRKWGSTYVSFDTLVNMTHMPSHEVKNALAELQAKRLLDGDLAPEGKYSLNSGKRGEIEVLIKHKIKA